MRVFNWLMEHIRSNLDQDGNKIRSFIFTISNNGITLTYDPPQSYVYTWNNSSKKYMDGRYFLDFKEDLSVFDNNEKGIYFATKICTKTST